jgi:hypothetical protein
MPISVKIVRVTKVSEEASFDPPDLPQARRNPAEPRIRNRPSRTKGEVREHVREVGLVAVCPVRPPIEKNGPGPNR